MFKQATLQKAISLLIFLFITLSSYSQLPDFNLTVTTVPQTCLGNGALNLSVSGTNPAASIDYTIYLLPDTTNPLTVVTTNTVSNLFAGQYLVVATQSLGAESNQKTKTVTIADNYSPLQIALTETKVRCGADGAITVSLTSGEATGYSITGPVNLPVQTSNVLSNLEAGFYLVKVYNSCGDVETQNFTLTAAQTSLSINAGSITTNEALPDCNSIGISHAYNTEPGKEIFFPLTFEITVYPPGGGTPTVITQVVPNGNVLNDVFETVIPFYHGQQYSYNIKVTNACGAVYTKNGNTVNEKMDTQVSIENPNCTDLFFKVKTTLFVPPYTVQFTSVPENSNFNPTDFNAQHPSFTSSEIQYGGVGNSVPEGDYTIKVTDACGRIVTKSFEVKMPEPEPGITPKVLGCSPTGSIAIEIPDRNVTSVIITGAPQDFITAFGALDYDASALITAGSFLMEGLPLGFYDFIITDNCGKQFIREDIELAPNSFNPNITVTQRPGCSAGFGSIKLDAENNFTSVIITQGPTGPMDVSNNIVTSGSSGVGDFYMNNLPAGGPYIFVTVDVCGITRTKEVFVEDYEILNNEVELIPHCGSFDIFINHSSTNIAIPSFWLQQYNEATGKWGYLGGGQPYTEGTLPGVSNSINLVNNNTTLNLAYIGKFRIIKAFYVFSNGAAANTRCTDVIKTFTFEDGPRITDIYNFPCAGGTNEVIVEVFGVPPFTYRIIEKNGQPFIVENGTSNIFWGLEAAEYKFEVTDNCGRVRPAPYTLNALDPVAITASGFCEGEASTLSVQPYSFLNYEWYRQDAPGVILSNNSVLEFPAYQSATQAGIYVVSITSPYDGSCLNQTLSYTVQANTLPNAGADAPPVILCNDGSTLTLASYLVPPFDGGGTWQDMDGSGGLNGGSLDMSSITQGTYTYKYTVNGICGTFDEAVVTLIFNDIPDAPTVLPVPEVCEGDDVQLQANSTEAGASYQWSGPNGFTSGQQNPVITGAGTQATGVYSVTVTVSGCTSAPATVNATVNAFPDFTLSGASSICDGQTAELEVVGNNLPLGVTYTWYHDDILLPGVNAPVIEISETGVYRAVVANGSCEMPQQFTVALSTNAFTLITDNGCKNYEYVLSVTNLNDIDVQSIEWTGPEGYSHSGEEAVITGLPAGDYKVVVLNTDGCSAEAIIPVENTSCIIPRGISPNGDAFNENFDLSNLDVRYIKIFNRYGLKVYEKDNYINEWYGQSDKGELPTGTYYYVVTLSQGKNVTGWVYLQREIK
jgi:gliding motility-associated-like protein